MTIIAIDPNLVSGRLNLATIIHQQGHYNNALQIYKKIISEIIDHPDAIHNLSNILIMMGKFSEGWVKFETRWKVFSFEQSSMALDKDKIWKGEEGGELRYLEGARYRR